MELMSGKVVDGKIVVEGVDLPEGKTVSVIIDQDAETFDLPPEDVAELEDRIKSAEAGNYVDGDELLSRLRNRGQQ